MERWIGRTGLITGVTRGIGAELVKRLTSKGINVVGCARSLDQLQDLSEKVKELPGRFHPIKCDLAKEADILAMFDVIKKEHGGAVDVCILNAGLSRSVSLLNGTAEQWRTEWEVNVQSRCICTREFMKCMKEREADDGHIIHINSILSHQVGLTATAHHYSATKWASRALVIGLRQELRDIKSNIRVTEVCPGLVKTSLWDYKGKEVADKSFDLNPHLEVEDVAGAVEYVLSAPPHVEVHDVILANPYDYHALHKPRVEPTSETHTVHASKKSVTDPLS